MSAAKIYVGTLHGFSTNILSALTLIMFIPNYINMDKNFKNYLKKYQIILLHACFIKICTILHEERKRVKKYTHNVDRGETLWVLSKMRNWLFNFHAGLFPYSCPIQTIQNHSGSGITDYHRVPYTFYAHVKHC